MNISIEKNEIPHLNLNDKEVRQLVLNLVRNGFESMPSGGSLTVKTYAENAQVVLAVKDQGPGITPEIIDKIGTPFITTKENGTGLGLAVCYSIAQRHNARITFDTGPDGTTFYVRFNVKDISGENVV
ncbi:MAG: ATP-binding protein [Bacillota bacterium]